LTGKTEDDSRVGRGWLSVTAAGLHGLEGSPRHHLRITEYVPSRKATLSQCSVERAGWLQGRALSPICTEKHSCQHTYTFTKSGRKKSTAEY